jgi:ribonuclease HI
MSKIEVYSDGSGNTFESDGGYGFVIIQDGAIIHEGSGYISSATNNVAEITAAIEGLSYVERQSNSGLLNTTEITLISDSQLVLGYASGKYKCKALHLTQLYISLRKIYTQLNAKQHWVKGHSGNPYNERCDVLAKTARESKGIKNEKK